MSKVYDVLDISKYVINRFIEIDRPIDNLQLQKILYYLQGSYLAEYNDLLFENDIVSWRYGPVVPFVYNKYKKFGAEKLSQLQMDVEKFYFEDDIEDCLDSNEEDNTISLNLPKDRIDFINKIIDSKSKLTGIAMIMHTHMESPWKETDRFSVINTDKLKDYFKSDEGRKHYA